MKNYVIAALAMSAVAGMLAFSGAPANAKTAAECASDYAANKAAIKASGQTKKDYVAACRAGPTAGAPAPIATPTPVATAIPTAGTKTAAQCAADYAANKAAIKASGQTKKDFIAGCRAGSEPTPTTPEPKPTPVASPAPYKPVPAPQYTPKPQIGATGAGGFATDSEAHARCPADTVVWVNTKSHVYHFAGMHNYGTTKQGTYMCEADAKAAGDRAAENEKHP